MFFPHIHLLPTEQFEFEPSPHPLNWRAGVRNSHVERKSLILLNIKMTVYSVDMIVLFE